MNLEKLELGMIVKNYKAMCELVGEPIQAGNSKKSQIKNWDLNFKYSKIGNKFIIEEIFDKALEKQENRGGARNTVYSDVVQVLILDLLAQSEGLMYIGKTKLMNVIGMVNYNYSNGKGSMNKLAKYLESDIRIVRDFYNTSDSNLRSAIDSSLKSLKNKLIIDYSNVKKVKDSLTGGYRLATDDEISVILVVENQVMNRLGYDSKEKLRCSADWNKFRNTSKNIVSQLTSIEYYFDAYKIIVNNHQIESERNKLINSLLLSNDERIKTINEMNQIILERIHLNAQKRHEKSNNGDITTMVDYRAQSTYVKDIDVLSNLLINIKCDLNINDLIKTQNKEDIDINGNVNLSKEMIEYIDEQLEGLF